MRFIGEIILIYFAIRLILSIVAPYMMRTAVKQMRDQFQSSQQPPQNPGPGPRPQAEEKYKKSEGDYIDYEEVK